ncbi:MAG: tryptophan-rich sensory protein [Bauldia sp.]|nr:MAG: tryptophan-rich sensory protein [Bauldia sp.]
MTRFIPLFLFVVLVVGGGLLLGIGNPPGAWYAGLEKPPFNPPDWVFAPVWTLLYLAVAVAGWRIWRMRDTGGAMTAWWLQLGLNFLWTPVFFGLHEIGWALAVILALLATIAVFVRLAWDRDRPAALLFLPYGAWVAFATLLTASIWWLN